MNHIRRYGFIINPVYIEVRGGPSRIIIYIPKGVGLRNMVINLNNRTSETLHSNLFLSVHNFIDNELSR